MVQDMICRAAKMALIITATCASGSRPGLWSVEVLHESKEAVRCMELLSCKTWAAQWVPAALCLLP